MAVTRITHTKDGISAINYVLSGKAHYSNKYVSKRFITSSGVNCTVEDCRQQFNAVWKRYGINQPNKKNRRQVQRLVQSFDPQQLDYRRPKDVSKANKIGQKLASRLYPSRQSIIITQSDNKHHILHNHIITNMLDFRTGRSMTRRQTYQPFIAKISDSIINSYGLNPERHKIMKHNRGVGNVHETNAEYHIKHSGRYSWINDLRTRVRKSATISVNWSNFMNICNKNGVRVDPYRKHKGHIRHDSNGSPIFKTHITYSFTDKNNHKRTARDRRLGTNYNHGHLMIVITSNNEAVKRVKEAKIKAVEIKRRAKVQAKISKRKQKEITQENHRLIDKNYKAKTRLTGLQRKIFFKNHYLRQILPSLKSFKKKVIKFIFRRLKNLWKVIFYGRFYLQGINDGIFTSPTQPTTKQINKQVQKEINKDKKDFKDIGPDL